MASGQLFNSLLDNLGILARAKARMYFRLYGKAKLRLR
ncbi:hypothetical protein SAMN05216578_103199 [Halopseudomonas formosensis]|uniref:Uncharacterized protein n=1 Tax=Halopseudomonas formosensis TaxID=1002526 RepID=A0A1I6B6N8_9GAMM|nr:hypothetical protein SAMN05216578_103199 [Halopseudomonas formosensis]